MYQQLWGYKVEEKLYLGVREQKRLNTTDVEHSAENIRTRREVVRAGGRRKCFLLYCLRHSGRSTEIWANCEVRAGVDTTVGMFVTKG
jgi:hypothetical protein